MKKCFKLLMVFLLMLFSIILASFVSFAEYDCEADGHALILEWDSFWDEYVADKNTDEIECWCEECGDTIYLHVEVEKHIKPASKSADGAVSYNAVASDDFSDYTDSYKYSNISKIDSISLSKTTYSYTGSEIKPSVTAYDKKGNKISSKYYTVSYSANKSVGIATVKVSFKTNYTGSLSKTYKIIPAKPTFSSVTAKGSTVTVKWVKQTAQLDNFQIQYSLSSKFSSDNKTVTTKKDVTSFLISNLTPNKTYYFRIRSVKSVGGKSYYSDWSAAKSVKINVLALNPTSVTIYKGKTKTLATVKVSGISEISWKSSNTSVAKVSSKGVITAVAKGGATITASAKYKGKTYSAKCAVIVKNPSISLDKTSATIYVGKVKKMYSNGTVTLKATTSPASQKITWISGDTKIATVSAEGKVTPKKKGTVTITAKMSYGGKTYSKDCKITVKEKAAITIKSVTDFSDSFYYYTPCIEFKNNTNSKIRYIEFSVYYLDEDGYYVYDVYNYKGSLLYSDSLINKGSTRTMTWSENEFNDQVHAILIDSVNVTYEDGAKEKISVKTAYWDSCCYKKYVK